jgi:hypothetical protein
MLAPREHAKDGTQRAYAANRRGPGVNRPRPSRARSRHGRGRQWRRCSGGKVARLGVRRWRLHNGHWQRRQRQAGFHLPRLGHCGAALTWVMAAAFHVAKDGALEPLRAIQACGLYKRSIHLPHLRRCEAGTHSSCCPRQQRLHASLCCILAVHGCCCLSRACCISRSGATLLATVASIARFRLWRWWLHHGERQWRRQAHNMPPQALKLRCHCAYSCTAAPDACSAPLRYRVRCRHCA